MLENIVMFVIGAGFIEVGLDLAQQAWTMAEPTVNQGIEAAKGLVD
jgi:hypothetical protein